MHDETPEVDYSRF
jgi:WD40 repeat protein